MGPNMDGKGARQAASLVRPQALVFAVVIVLGLNLLLLLDDWLNLLSGRRRRGEIRTPVLLVR